MEKEPQLLEQHVREVSSGKWFLGKKCTLPLTSGLRDLRLANSHSLSFYSKSKFSIICFHQQQKKKKKKKKLVSHYWQEILQLPGPTQAVGLLGLG